MEPDSATPAYLYDIFLAYEGHDRALADRLDALLCAEVSVFYAPRSLENELGEFWPGRLVIAQRHSRITLALVADRSTSSAYFAHEIVRAINYAQETDDHQLIPVFIDGPVHRYQNDAYGLLAIQGIVMNAGDTVEMLASRILNYLRMQSGAAPVPLPEEPFRVHSLGTSGETQPGSESYVGRFRMDGREHEVRLRRTPKLVGSELELHVDEQRVWSKRFVFPYARVREQHPFAVRGADATFALEGAMGRASATVTVAGTQVLHVA